LDRKTYLILEHVVLLEPLTDSGGFFSCVVGISGCGRIANTAADCLEATRQAIEAALEPLKR